MSVAFAPRAWPSRDADGRTRQKVLRNSREAMTNETPEYLNRRQRSERIAAFRRHATQSRVAGRRRGHGERDHESWSYSAIAGDVFDYLMFHAESTGRVYPSYEQIAAAVGCAYRTAVRVIHQLARGGWISWERRFVRTGKEKSPEPQVEQTSNLYRIHLPTVAGQLIRAWRARRPPPPDDVANARDPDEEARDDAAKRLVAAQAFMEAARSPEELELFTRRAAALQSKLDLWSSRYETPSTPVDGSTQREFPEG